MARPSSNELSRAVLDTLAYSDIFDHPLTVEEVHRYLVGVRTTVEEVRRALDANDRLEKTEIYFTLPGRIEIVEIRKEREARSRKLLPLALKYGRILGSLPFVRMAALTGSLAVMNASDRADFDYMLVAASGRVWTARAFALLVNRLARLSGHTLCPNLIVSENALEWRQRDLYSARELCQMIPVTGSDVYDRLLKANEWVEAYLPNAYPSLRGERSSTNQSPSPYRRLIRRSFQSLLAMTEHLLRGKSGDRFERWEMSRKISRFSKQPGFGEETVFNAEMCQGNFGHHRKRTQDAFDERLRNHVIANPERGAWVKRSSTQAEIASPLRGSR